MDVTIDAVQGLAAGSTIRAIIMALIILAITAVIAHLLTKLIRRCMQTDGVTLPSSSILVNIGRSVVWVMGICVMLSSCFNVDVNALIAALGIGGVALSLGLQDTIKNFIGGLQVTLMRIVEPGDHIAVGSAEGIVQDINWRQTTVKDYENAIHIIPNSIMGSSEVQKFSPSFIVTTEVVLNTDGREVDDVLRRIEEAAKDALKNFPVVKDPWLLVTRIGEFGVWAKMRFVLEDVEYAREARNTALRAIAPYTRNSASDLGEETEVTLSDEG